MSHIAIQADQIKDLLIRACSEAGEVIMRYHDQRVNPSAGETDINSGFLKDPIDPRTVVSKADLESEQRILDIFGTNLTCNFVAEESAPTLHSSERLTIIADPLDGSRNFIHRTLGLFGISIGIASVDQIIAGAVYLPFFDELLLTVRGTGVQLVHLKQRGPNEPIGISVVRETPVPVSLSRLVIARGTAEPTSLTEAPLANLMARCNEVMNFACCTASLNSVVMGRIDGLVVRNQKCWDFAGGVPILREIGAHIGIWRSGWRDPISEADLALSTKSDFFDIVATRSRTLFDEIVHFVTQA